MTFQRGAHEDRSSRCDGVLNDGSRCPNNWRTLTFPLCGRCHAKKKRREQASASTGVPLMPTPATPDPNGLLDDIDRLVRGGFGGFVVTDKIAVLRNALRQHAITPAVAGEAVRVGGVVDSASGNAHDGIYLHITVHGDPNADPATLPPLRRGDRVVVSPLAGQVHDGGRSSPLTSARECDH